MGDWNDLMDAFGGVLPPDIAKAQGVTRHGAPKDRAAYQRAYYEANKERLKALRKPKPRTEAGKAAEARYREKKRILAEISKLPVPTIDDA